MFVEAAVGALAVGFCVEKGRIIEKGNYFERQKWEKNWQLSILNNPPPLTQCVNVRIVSSYFKQDTKKNI